MRIMQKNFLEDIMPTNCIIAITLLAFMCVQAVATPYHPDLALVAINLAFAVGCAVEGILICRS